MTSRSSGKRFRCYATSSRGQYVATDLHRVGGIPQVMKMLLSHGLLHGNEMTITGRTIAENLAEIPDAPRKDQRSFHQWESPMYAQAISRSSRAISRPRAASPRSPASSITRSRVRRACRGEEDSLDAILAGKITAATSWYSLRRAEGRARMRRELSLPRRISARTRRFMGLIRTALFGRTYGWCRARRTEGRSAD